MLPKLTTIELWAASLIVDFPDSNIPILKGAHGWKAWGNSLVQENVFADNHAPGTAMYDDPKKWMESVFYTMANF